MKRSNLLGFAIGPVGAAVLSFISFPVITWIFPQVVVGQLSMLQVATGLSTVFFCFGLDQAYVREYHESDDRAALLLNASAPGFIMLAIILAGLMLVAPRLLSRALFEEGSVALGLLVTICLVSSYVSRFLSLILRMQDRGLAYSMSQLLSKLILIVLIVGYAWFLTSRSLTLLVLAQASAFACTMLVFAWNTRRDWVPAFGAALSIPMLKSLLAFGSPLILGALASWGLAVLDRVFLRSLSSFSELAVYSVAASIASGVTIVAGIFNTVWSPMVYRWVADDADMDKINVIAHNMGIVCVIVICCAGGAGWILRYLLPSEYAGIPYIVVGCMLSPLLYTLSEVTGVGVAVARRTIYSMVSSIVAVFVNAAMCLLLVRRFGAAGAMVSTVVAYWVFFVMRTEFSAMVWRSMPRVRIHAYVTLLSITSIGFALFGSKAGSYACLSWLLALIFFVFMERKGVGSMLRSLFRQLGRSPVIEK